MKRSVGPFLCALAMVTACDSSPRPPPPVVVPTLALTPISTALQAGGAPLEFTATLINSTEAIAWSLSPAVGTLSADNGASVTYAPPASVDGTTPVIVTVEAAGLQAQAIIVVKPLPAVSVSPALAYLPAGAQPLTLTATPVNAGDTATWSLDPAVGVLAAVPSQPGSAQYTPPATLGADTTVTVSVSVGGVQGQAKIVVTPSSALAITPATSEVQAAGAALGLTATLTGSTAAIAWSLTPAIGTLSATTGSSVNFTPPATVAGPTTVVVGATAGDTVAHAVITIQPLPVLTVNPTGLSLPAGGSSAIVAATLLFSSETITWALSPAVGTLSATSGVSVVYTPPASLASATSVTLTASAAGLSASVAIALTVTPTLSLSPTTATVPGGGTPVVVTATQQNLTGPVVWSLSPSLGTLSSTSGSSVSYTPPADVGSNTPVTVFAIGGSQVAQAVVTVTPCPKLSVTPATASLTTASSAQTLTATLLNSSAPITWTLDSTVGSLSASSGASVSYTPPALLGRPTTVIVTASAAGLTAQATLTIGPALGAENTPLLKKDFVPFSRVVEYMILGASYNEAGFDGSQENQFVVDPYRAYGNIDDQPLNLPAGLTLSDHSLLHHSLNLDAASSKRKVARAGNLDDDFPDETVVLSWSSSAVAKLSILDASLPAGNLSADPTLTSIVPAGIDLTVAAGQTANDYDLALADVDADGLDEIIVLGTILDNLQARPGKLWVFDDLNHGCALLSSLALPGFYDTGSGTHLGMLKAKLAAGSMKNDRSVQLVVAWYDSNAFNSALTTHLPVANNGALYIGIPSFNYVILDSSLAQIGGVRHPSALLQTEQHLYALANPNVFNVALADVDGDLKKELVFAAWNSSWYSTATQPESGVAVDIFDDLDAAGSSGSLPELIIDGQKRAVVDAPLTQASVASYPERFLIPIDWNNDHVEELVVGPYPCHFKAASGTTPASLTWDDALIPIDGVNAAIKKQNYHANVNDVQAGDVNGDLRQDFLVLYKDAHVSAWGLRNHLLNVSGNPLVKNYSPTPDFVNLDVSGTGGSAYNATAILVPVNVDNDSTLLQYTGEHSLYYRDNKLIALLAAPPVTDGLGQNTGNSFTTLGTMTGGTFGAGSEFSTRSGVVMGMEVEISTGFIVSQTALSISMEMQTQLEYTHNNSWSQSVTRQITDGATDGQDLVVFSATPYDRYTYVLASNPNTSAIGIRVNVDVPQATQVMSVSRETYNREFSEGLLITTALLQDTPYDLSSYPTTAVTAPTLSMVDVGNGLQMQSRIIPFGSMGPYNISESGSKQCQLDISADLTWQEGVNSSLDFTAKVAVFGVLGGGGGGYTSGGYQEHSTSNGIVFGAGVNGLPPAAFTAANKYSWGMNAYKQTLFDGQGKVSQDFIVVNYWTGPYGVVGP